MKNIKSLLVSMAIALVFLFFAWRGLDTSELAGMLEKVPLQNVLVLIALAIAGVVIRAWRWWYLLPKPALWREFGPCQRALAVGYAVNNVVPRLGEVVRIVMAGKATRRPYPVLAASVVVDRLILDLIAATALVAVAIGLYNQTLSNLFTGLQFRFWILVAVILGAIFFFFLFGKMLKKAKANPHIHRQGRLKGFWNWFFKVSDQFQKGMTGILTPARFGLVTFLTVLLWGSYLLSFYVATKAFNIQISFGPLIAAFAITNIGMALPSPGGLGTFHYFAQISLVGLAGVAQETAAAFAIYLHGINFLTQIGYGAICFGWEKFIDSGQSIEAQEQGSQDENYQSVS